VPSNITINFEYDKTELLELFNNSEKEYFTPFSRSKAILGANASESDIFTRYFDAFPFIPKYDDSIELVQITGNSPPHINPGNNGLLIFPVSGNPLILNTYSYVTPFKDINSGRPIMDLVNMSPEQVTEIESTLIETKEVNQPIAVNGLQTFSIHTNAEPCPIILVLKVPVVVNWSTVYNFMKKDTYVHTL
jgi:hypothetical protein